MKKNNTQQKEEKIFIAIISSLIVVISLSLFIFPTLETSLLAAATIDAQTIVSVSLLALLLGLIDGFNPCAMWVLIYLISLVSELKDRKKMWLIVGTFLFASGIIYFIILYMYLFSWDYISYIGYSNYVIIGTAILAIGCGLYFIIDYIKSKGKAECKVGDFQTRQKTMSKMKDIVNSPLTIPTFLAIVVLAFSVNLFEFVCSIGIPQAFTGILQVQDFGSIGNFAMIALYILTFLADDLLIFYLSLKAIESPVFERYSSTSKIAGGILMLVIGLIILLQIYFQIEFMSLFLYVLLGLLLVFDCVLLRNYYKK